MRDFVPPILAGLLGGGLNLAVLGLAAGRWDEPAFWCYASLWPLTMIALVSLADRDMIRRRYRRNRDPELLRVRLTALPVAIAILTIAGLDVGRQGWSTWLPIWAQVLGFVGLIAVIALILAAMRKNPFFMPDIRIQEESGHHPISSGPYGWIRHPGYLGFMSFAALSAPALGSIWAVLPSPLIALLLIRRIRREERFLLKNLEGYRQYAERVRWRLVPGIW